MRSRILLAFVALLIFTQDAYAQWVPTGGGGSSGVSQVVAGSGITVSPAGGTGVVTVTSTSSGGSVTSFSSGNLTPLFTTSVATATSTPALSFALSNAGGTSWFGNATGTSAPPAFNTSVIPNALINFASPAAIGSTTPAAVSATNLTVTGTVTLPTLSVALGALAQGGASTNQVITWNGTTWAPASPAGTGTVTSFSSGNLTPLFTTSVATATSTPALSFTLSAATNPSWFGATGSTTPAYQAGAVPTTLGGLGTTTAPSAVGQIPINTTGNTYTPATLTAGTNVTITNASGAITINSTGGGGGGGLANGGNQATSFSGVINNYYQITGTATCTLPTAVSNPGEIDLFVGASGSLTINTTSSQTISSNGAAYASGALQSANPGDAYRLTTDGANWSLQYYGSALRQWAPSQAAQSYRNWHTLHAQAGSSSIVGANATATTGGTLGNVTTGSVSQTNVSTGTTTNTAAFIQNGAGNTIFLSLNPHFQAYVQTGTSLAAQRIIIGLTSNLGSTLGSDTPSVLGAYFRLSSTASDTAPQCITNNAGTLTVLSSGVTAIVSTWHLYQIDGVGSSMVFRIDGAVVQVISTNLPPTTNALGVNVGIQNTTTTSESIGFGSMEWDIN